MKRSINTFCIVALLYFLSGCALPIEEKAYVYPPPPILDQGMEKTRLIEERSQKAEEIERNNNITIKRLRLETMKEVRDSIDDFKSSIAAGSCGKAERQANALMGFTHSDSNKLEIDMFSAICLCYLEKDGDVSRFSQCSDELQKLTTERRYLDQETQLVLSLQPYFSHQTNNQRDPRIDLSIALGVQSILKSNK